MLQPLSTMLAGAETNSMDISGGTAISGLKASSLAGNGDFNQMVQDYSSTELDTPVMKELAAGIQNVSDQSGESSPLLPAESDTTELSLDGMNKEDLMAYLMANGAGGESANVAPEGEVAEVILDGIVDGEQLLETVDGALNGETDIPELSIDIEGDESGFSLSGVESTEGSSISFIETEMDLNGNLNMNGSAAAVQGVVLNKVESTVVNPELVGQKIAEESVPVSLKVGTEKLTAEQQSAAGVTTATSETARQNMVTTQANQMLSEQAIAEQSQQKLQDSAKQVSLTQAQMTAQNVELDELSEPGLDKNLRTPADLQMSSNVQAKNQPSLDLQNLQQSDNAARPMRMLNAASALSERIQTMINSNTQSANIRLDPPELGSLEVRVQVRNEQTHVQIVTQNSQTREALEQQSVRLRESLAEQGINLSNLDVSDQQTQERSGSGEGEQGSGRRGGGLASEADAADERETIVSTSLGYVDQYV